MSMACSKCGAAATKVMYTALRGMKLIIVRRRKCLECGFRFTTHERPVESDEDKEKVAAAVLDLIEKGYTYQGAATKFGLTYNQVNAIVQKHRHRGEPGQSPHPKEPSS